MHYWCPLTFDQHENFSLHSQNWYSRWGRRFHFKVATESFPSWDTIRGGFLFRIRGCINWNGIYFSSQEQIAYFFTQALRKLSTSSFLLNFSECKLYVGYRLWENMHTSELIPPWVIRNSRHPMCPRKWWPHPQINTVDWLLSKNSWSNSTVHSQ